MIIKKGEDFMNNNFKYIKEEIEKEIQNCNISGASVCIIKDGK